jgi:hypothetical protein
MALPSMGSTKAANALRAFFTGDFIQCTPTF